MESSKERKTSMRVSINVRLHVCQCLYHRSKQANSNNWTSFVSISFSSITTKFDMAVIQSEVNWSTWFNCKVPRFGPSTLYRWLHLDQHPSFCLWSTGDPVTSASLMFSSQIKSTLFLAFVKLPRDESVRLYCMGIWFCYQKRSMSLFRQESQKKGLELVRELNENVGGTPLLLTLPVKYRTFRVI